MTRCLLEIYLALPKEPSAMLKRKESTDMTFEEIQERDGEQAAIQAGIAADPDTFELDDEWFAQARPTKEVDPEPLQNGAT